MALLAITVLGHDRPGIIADVTATLAGRDANVEDSSMTLLRGHFAWTLVVGTTASAADLASDLAFLESDDLVVSVLPVPADEQPAAGGGPSFVISVHGADRVGIVAAITGAIASYGGNITDLQTRLGGELYVVVAEVDFPADVDMPTLTAALKAVAETVGVDVAIQPADQDVL